MAIRRGAKQFPVVMTFSTTVDQEARLQRARAKYALNMSQFMRDALTRALDDLEGKNEPAHETKTEPGHARRIAMPSIVATDRSR